MTFERSSDKIYQERGSGYDPACGDRRHGDHRRTVQRERGPAQHQD
jgi:hypothetical protein